MERIRINHLVVLTISMLSSTAFSQVNTCNDAGIVQAFYPRQVPSEGTTVNYWIPEAFNDPQTENRLLGEPLPFERNNLWVYEHRRKAYEEAIMDIVCLTDYRPEQIRAVQLARLNASSFKRTILYDMILPVYTNPFLGLDEAKLSDFENYYDKAVDIKKVLETIEKIIALPPTEDLPDFVYEFMKDPDYKIPINEFSQIQKELRWFEGVLKWASYIESVVTLSKNLGDFVFTTLITQTMANEFALNRLKELKSLILYDNYYQDQALFDALDSVESYLSEDNNDEKALAFLNSVFDNRSAILENVDAITTLCGTSYVSHITNLIAGNSVPLLSVGWMMGAWALKQEIKIILNIADQYDNAEQAIILSTLAYRICDANQNTACDFQKMSIYGYSKSFYYVKESFDNPPWPFIWDILFDFDEVVNQYNQYQIYANSVLDSFLDCDNVPPTVIGQLYTETTGTNYIIRFSEDIDPASISPSAVIVEGNVSGLHNCFLSYESATSTLTIDPETDFTNGEIVTVTLTTGIRDLAGNEIDGDSNGTEGPDFSFYSLTTGVAEVSNIEIVSSDYSPDLNRPVTITATLKDRSNSIVSGENVTFSHTNVGTFSGNNPVISDVNGNATITYTPTAGGDHNISARTSNGRTGTITITIGGSKWPPTIVVNNPNNIVCDEECYITWSASDPDNNPTIYLYYDNNNTGYNGTCINPGNPIFKDVANAYMWNTNQIAEGQYWIYAVINDGTNQASDYSPGYVEIKHPEPGTDLAYYSRSTEDNGDADEILESGETFEMKVRVRNLSYSETYQEVSGILTSSNPSVIITDNDSFYGDIGPRLAFWGNDDYKIQVASGFTGDVDFDLTVRYKDSEGYKYYQILDIPDIYISENVSPSFSVTGVQIVDDGSKSNNDGFLQSGENSIQYRLQLTNNSTGDAVDVYCEAQALPEGFDTGVNTASYPDIDAGSSEWPDIDDHFILRQIPNDFTGDLTAFLRVTWADEAFSQLVPFTLEVTPAPRLLYDPETSDFGIKAQGETAIIPVTLTNYGSSDLTITQIENVSGNPGNSLTGVTFPVTLAPSGSVIININITRSNSENVNETFRIHSNNHNGSTHDILISGTFYNPTPQGYKKLWESTAEANDNCLWAEPADLDNDGLIDIAMYYRQYLYIWEQAGINSMEFEHKFTWVCPGVDPYIKAIQIGNCDGDTKKDIVLRTYEQNEPQTGYLRILESTANDQYTQVWNISTGNSAYYEHLTVGNSDTDTEDEIIICNAGATSIILYNRTGDNSYQTTWNSGTIVTNYCSYHGYSTTGDSDKDGRNEIILLGRDNYVFIWEYYNGNYSLVHTPAVSSADPEWNIMARPVVGDVDNDNLNEIIVTSEDASSGWQFSVFNPEIWSIGFHNSPGEYGDCSGPTVADVNGNGIPEIFFGEVGSPYRMIVFENSGGSYFETFSYSNGNDNEVFNIKPFDLNKDGKPELVVSNYNSFMIWGYEEIPVLPDLQIASNNITFSVKEPTDADDIGISAVIQNIGTSGAAEIPVEFYISNPENGNRIDSTSVANLLPGSSQTITVNWNSYQTGDFDVYVVIDRNNVIDELNSDNNIRFKTLTVTDNDILPPDFISHSQTEFYGDEDGLVEDNEYIIFNWSVDDASGINSTYILYNGTQILNAFSSGNGAYYAVVGSQPAGLFPFEIHATDNDNSQLSSLIRDTIRVVQHAPNVISQTPADGASDVLPDISLIAGFDVPMSSSSINPNTFILRETATSVSVPPVTVSYDPETKQAVFIPSQLRYGTSYTVLLSFGVNGIKDINNNVLEYDVSWTFQTIAEPLKADFIVSDQTPDDNTTVSFLDISTGSPTTWLWDFGDGGTSNEQSPTHIYIQAGIYDVTLTIGNGLTNDAVTKADYIRVSVEDMLPSVTTSGLSFVTTTSATGGGIVTDEGLSPVTARGICWSSDPNPNIELNSKTIDGSGPGIFISNIPGLTASFTYYVRAYATNSYGTVYGNEISFTTPGEDPSVTLLDDYVLNNIMTGLKIVERIKSGTMNIAIDQARMLSDNYSNCEQIGDFIVYTKTARSIDPTDWTIAGGTGYTGDRLPENLQIKFAWKADGTVYMGASGTDDEVLAAIADGADGSSGCYLGERTLFEGFALYSELRNMQTAAYVTGITSLNDLRTADFYNNMTSKIFNRFTKPIFRIFSAVAMQASPYTSLSPEYAVWCPYPGLAIGTGTRSFLLNYTNSTNAYVLAVANNDNGNSSYIRLDGTFAAQKSSWERNYYRRTAVFPGSIEIGTTITWAHGAPRFSMAVVCDEVTVANISQTPSGGLSNNRAPVIMAFPVYVSSSATQSIDLTPGWNILSFNAEPADKSMMNIVDPLITSDVLVKVQDETGRAIERLAIGWIYGIGEMSVTEGYKMRVTQETDLTITGEPVTLPLGIPLAEGWNIIGYPSATPQSAEVVFGPLALAGTLVKVQDEEGNALEKIGDAWTYGITNLEPGKGYSVKVSSNTILTIGQEAKGEVVIQEKERTEPVHFRPVYEGKGLDHMNIYLEMGEEGLRTQDARLREGNEIGVFDGEICVGSAVVEKEGKYIQVIASFDDPVTQEKDGFAVGNTLELRLWDMESGTETVLTKTEPAKGYSMTFERQGTTVLTTKLEGKRESWLGDAYPNPSRDRTTFTFGLSDESRVRLEIIDVMGNLVSLLIDEKMTGGSHEFVWENCSYDGTRVKPGIYFYKLSTNKVQESKKLLVN